MAIRYPPYRGKLKQLQTMQDLKPNFDRLGRSSGGLIGWVLRFGAQSTRGALARYFLVVMSKLIPYQ
jgi:beta-apo-4'-carotenal oxygenase